MFNYKHRLFSIILYLIILANCISITYSEFYKVGETSQRSTESKERLTIEGYTKYYKLAENTKQLLLKENPNVSISVIKREQYKAIAEALEQDGKASDFETIMKIIK